MSFYTDLIYIYIYIYILNRIRTEAYAYLVFLLEMNAIVKIMAIKLYVNVVETN